MDDREATGTLTGRERLAIAAVFAVAIAVSIVVVLRLGAPPAT